MNIFGDSNYGSQSSMPSTATFNEITTNGLIFPNGQSGDLLYLNPSKEVNGIQIGPQNYIVQSDGTKPQYTNVLNVNTITSTVYKIPGTTHGDLFTVDTNNNLERVPISNVDGSLLVAEEGEFRWLEMPNGNAFIDGGYLNAEQSQNWSDLAYVNFPPLLAIIFTFNSACFAGKKYKITYSGNFAIDLPLTYFVSTPLITLNQGQLFTTGPICRSFIYTATGADVFRFNVATPSVTSGCNGFEFLIERF